MSWYKPLIKNKYKAKKTERAGYSFASQLEAALFDHLKWREKAGEITNILCQQSVYLTRAKIQYIADFSYFDKESKITTYAEAKGVEMPAWRLKRRLWLHYGAGPLLVYKGSHKRITLHETLYPKEDAGGDVQS